jgi:hypothetical protein
MGNHCVEFATGNALILKYWKNIKIIQLDNGSLCPECRTQFHRNEGSLYGLGIPKRKMELNSVTYVE